MSVGLELYARGISCALLKGVSVQVGGYKEVLVTTLVLDCSARKESSVSRDLTRHLSDLLSGPKIYRDLGEGVFPALSGDDLMSLHGKKPVDRESLAKHADISRQLILELRTASVLVVGMPIYNFSVPATLKQWIDYVVQPGVTFRYESGNPVGLCDNIATAYLVVSSGGTVVGGPHDYASKYVEWICRFLGVKEVHHIDAGGSKRSRVEIVSEATSQIRQLLA